MTVRLYYGDSYLREFSATIVDQCQTGAGPAVVLDQTAFYPTSGGQPFDTGVLGPARVINVEEDESGRILHLLDSPLSSGPIHGAIDWNRRFDHMQQHTGQHILSQAFVEAAQAPTISFHLGSQTSTIDLQLAGPSNAMMYEAEELASEIVFEDRPVHVLNVSREELSDLGVRKTSQRQGDVRVIDVEGFDRSPCGGTHVRRSGEIGIISILGFERYKGGTRVEFVCGWRALRTLREDREILKNLARLHSGHFDDLPRLAEKALQDRQGLMRDNAKLREELLEFEGRDLLSQAEKNAGFLVVRKSFHGRTLESVKILAQKLVQRGGVLAILGLSEETGQVVVARSADVPGDCGSAVKTIAARHGGRGGGRPDLAQAGGIADHALEEWLQNLEAHFRRESG